jgi:hypothetical protein
LPARRGPGENAFDLKMAGLATRSVAAAVVAAALAPSASAQIIASSLPSVSEPTSGKKWAVHLMASPLAQWRYNEVFVDELESRYAVLGEIVGKPSSRVMLAGEVSFGRRDGVIVTAGGWYNKLGTHTFDIAGALILPPSPEFPDGYNDIHYAVFETNLSMAEGHAGVSYKGLGLQVGVVATSGSFDSGEFVNADGSRRTPRTDYGTLPDAKTMDYDIFAVYRRAFAARERLSVAVGVGAYRKQAGRKDTSDFSPPLRSGKDKTVLTAFAAAGVNIVKGLGVDVSYWYIGKSDATEEVGNRADLVLASDQQSRLTVGVGFTF